MHITLRKVMATIVCLAMLCTLLPVGALMSVSAEGTPAYSNDFENGIGTWYASAGSIEAVDASTAPVANPNGGNKVLKHTITDGSYP